MKIGHWQVPCKAGDVPANLARVVGGVAHADREGVALVSFPESLLTGYYMTGDEARRHSLTTDGPEIAELLAKTADFDPTFLVGYNELRGEDLYNTVLVARHGKLLGTYSKAFPCFDYFTPGRDFPVFQHEELTFGVLICADGGYIEPARILALKGAQLIMAPHYNYIGPQNVLTHYIKVRSDHAARAVENHIWFLRGNQVTLDAGEPSLPYDGVGYGDSYLMDPTGEIVARTLRHREGFLCAEIPLDMTSTRPTRSIASGRALLAQLAAALDAAGT